MTEPTSGNPIRNERIFFGLILLACAFVRIWHITWSLPDLYEEATPFNVAWRFWSWGNAGFDFNPNFFNYPALSFYIHFIIQGVYYVIGALTGSFADLEAFRQAFESDPTRFIVHARLVTVAFDLGVLLLVYAIGRTIAGSRVALCSSAIAAINRLMIANSQVVAVDTPLTFFILLSLLAILRVLNTGELRWYILSGLCIGLATAMKYTGGLLFGGLFLAHLLRASSSARGLRSMKSSSLLYSIILGGAVFVAMNPFIFTQSEAFLNDFTYEQHHMSYGHLGLDARQSSIGYYFLTVLPQNFGWVFAVLSVAGILFWLFSRDQSRLFLALVALAYLTMIGSWEMRAERYLLPVLPLMILAAVESIHMLTTSLFRKLSTLQRIRPVVVGILVAGIALPTLMAATSYHRTIGLIDTRTLASKWIGEHFPRGSAIATGPLGMQLEKSGFNVIPIPFTVVSSELMAPFYDTRWFEDLDLVIASDYDYGRYAAEPNRFSELLPYYDSLRLEWQKLFEVYPGESQTGPTIWLYAPPPAAGPDRFDESMMKRVASVPDTSLVSYFLEKVANPLFQRGLIGKSEQLMRRAVSLTPHNVQLRTALAYILFRAGDFENALTETEQCIRIDPASAEVAALHGSSLLRVNRLDEAERELLRAISMNTHLETCYLDLELLYRHRGERDKQIGILERYLLILPAGSENAEQTLSLIRELRGPA